MSRTYENELRDQAKILTLLKIINEIEGRVNFQKIVYLLQRNQKLFDYSFIFWYHGPYSKDLISDIDTLVMSGLVKENVKEKNDVVTYSYKLTDKGEEVLNEILATDNQLNTLLRSFGEGKEQIEEIGFNRLIEHVYGLMECKEARKKGIGTKVNVPR